ncbi:lanthionine synthetase C family protein [Nonomuraea insulae]|uniref:lanthionine synthetase C family protein n=1 Tax=Nonomuraea insulae TaxID=1616787 RepID=UPI0036D35B8F
MADLLKVASCAGESFQRMRARRMAECIAVRLAEEADREESITHESRQRVLGSRRGPSLYGGQAGSAVVFRVAAQAAEAGVPWEQLCRRALSAAAAATREQPLRGIGLAGGSSGLALALTVCAELEPGYSPSLARLSRRLSRQIVDSPPPRGDTGSAISDYDVVSGASGALGALLSLPADGEDHRMAIHALLDYLIWLCSSAPGLENWRISSGSAFPPVLREVFPHGYVDLGLAHGIAGPLAALAMAWMAGYRRPGQRAAMERTVDCLLESCVRDAEGRAWPLGVGLDEHGRRRMTAAPAGRTAWCYGAPGICCALLHASSALEDRALRAVAAESMEAAVRRLGAEARGMSSTLCHGLAGMLSMCQRFARTSDGHRFEHAIDTLIEVLLARCEASLPLMVQDLEADGSTVDCPSLLLGAAGVALALWSVSRPIGTTWERALMIS